MEAIELTRRMEDFYTVASDVLRDVNDLTEQQIKHWIVNPFLVSLGWDPHDKRQVYPDYPVKGEGHHIDYALLDLSGKPRLIIDVRKAGSSTTEATSAVETARAVQAPLTLLTNGHEFSLWFVSGKEAPTPLFVLRLKELKENPEALLGLTESYRLSDTGINQLRKTAIRLAVLQMLEENAEKTFDAMVDWVAGQVSPGELDETTGVAVREATMIWLTEEHLLMPAFSGSASDPRRHGDLRPTTVRDWESFPRGPAGTFQYKYDTTKTLDLRQSAKEVREALRMQGLKTQTATAFGGFYYALRQRAGLPTPSAA
ncbi:MAG: hypothetical protein L3K17_04020 [Thermoplasmata archaeon]|nr:hypothetical protein [Thermoplasmata archaeon]